MVGMEIRQDAPIFPSKCAVSGRSTGPFIDTGIEGDVGRVYVRTEKIIELAEFLGMVKASDYNALEEALKDREAEIERLESVEWELIALRESVRRTLDAGAVVDRETKGHRLRPKPGQKAVKVGARAE